MSNTILQACEWTDGAARCDGMTRRFVALAGAAVALGIATLLYHSLGRGPGRELVRGHAGDVAAAMLVYAVLGLAARRCSLRARAACSFGFAAAIECGQLLWHARSTLAELTIGTSFDPWDLVAYAVGVAVGVAWECRMRRPCASPSSPSPASSPVLHR
jgi:hypothetical protein